MSVTMTVRPLIAVKSKLSNKKVKVVNMSDQAVALATPVVNPEVYTGKVTKTIKNVFGSEQTMEGNIILPTPQSLNGINALEQGKETEIVFWYNFGRKMAARQQVSQSLDWEPETEDLRSLDKSFRNALSNMITKDTSDEKKKRVIDFILGEDKFAPLREVYANLDLSKNSITVDFGDGSTELKKPSGIKGRQKKKEDGAKEEDETETSE